MNINGVRTWFHPTKSETRHPTKLKRTALDHSYCAQNASRIRLWCNAKFIMPTETGTAANRKGACISNPWWPWSFIVVETLKREREENSVKRGRKERRRKSQCGICFIYGLCTPNPWSALDWTRARTRTYKHVRSCKLSFGWGLGFDPKDLPITATAPSQRRRLLDLQRRLALSCYP